MATTSAVYSMESMLIPEEESRESLTVLRERCRLIGIINQIYFSLSIIGLVVLTIFIVTDYHRCGNNNHNECHKITEIYLSVERHTTGRAATLMFLIFFHLNLVFFVKMIFVNNDLGFPEKLADEDKLDWWLRWHIVSFVICVVKLIVLLCYCYLILLPFLGIITIVHLLEIYVVRQFIGELRF